MPSSYTAGIPLVDVQRLFDRLVHHLPGAGIRSALADIYSIEFGDPDLGSYSLGQIRDQLLIEPIQLFDLVSLLLRDPPYFLSNVEDREHLAQALTIAISDFEQIRVTESGIWIRVLDLDSQTSIQINRYEYYPSSVTREITTTHIYDYLKSAAVCFRSGLLPSALALSAIAFEACLREVLTGINRHLLPQPPAYKRSSARVDAHLDATSGEPVLSFNVQGAAQKMHDYFMSQPPKGPKRFLGRLKLQIGREDASILISRSGNQSRATLRLVVDSGHIDLLSTDQREMCPGQRPAQKFSEFIAAAELAGRLRSDQLPRNSAEVIRTVRNNLVHWSENALAEPLGTGMTIKDYIHGTDTVRATIVDVSSFISDEYYALRQFEHTGSI